MLMASFEEILTSLRRRMRNRHCRQKRDTTWSGSITASQLSRTANPLEERIVLSSFTVINLNDAGAGSFRQAVLSANSTAGSDDIRFNVAGTITLTTGALPNVTDRLDILGTTAPGYAGRPIVELDSNSFGGLKFTAGAAGSSLRGLGVVNASDDGVTLTSAGNMLVSGNYIGLRLDGITIAGNFGNGLRVVRSTGNTIEGNLISGNIGNGIALVGASDNRVDLNLIGTDFTGTLDRGNAGSGIRLTAAAAFNNIGGSQGNLISGNNLNGVLLDVNATSNTVDGNIIGLDISGILSLGNTLDGVRLDHADGNLIGHSDPVSSITYNNSNNVSMQPVSGWQGIRNSDTSGQYLISGTSGDNGLLFDGTIDGIGTSYSVNYPGAAATSVYGPDNLDGNRVRLVGSYKNADASTAAVKVNGFLFEGTTADLTQSANYRTIDVPGAEFNYVHSTMGGLAVGNYDSAPDHGKGGLPLGPGHAYIYDVARNKFLTDVVFPHARSNTAYGIWYNGGTSYTICGGYSLTASNNLNNQDQPIGQAYLVDFDSATGKFSNWTSFNYPNGTNFVTHFEGISSVEKGVYTLSANSAQSGSTNPSQGSWVSVRRNTDGSFGQATWVDLNYPGLDPTTHISSSNAVYGNQVVGIVIGGGTTLSFQATVNTAFQLSNVISANGANGVGLYGGDDNQVAMNYVGTDISGTLRRGNALNGILLTSNAARNLIGGEATGGNSPSRNVFVQPPQGNVISGNHANGVFITGRATQNQLSGNFVGTNAGGNAALGNTLDGVAIDNADSNSLIGCTFQQDPFVFYNVISGNGGNGLRVTNANNTTIQANFFGIGADDSTAIGNALNGGLVEGWSKNTLMGGPIPLGNVDAANGQNGIVVRDTASYFTSYNTFCGIAAFSDNPTLGNGGDGMLITSTGGNILIRTNVISRNGDDGIEISGSARGVRVAGNIIGLNTQGLIPMGNRGNGVEIGGSAHDNVIGGPQPTFNIIPRNLISSNQDNGVAFVGNAHDNIVSNSYIGMDFFGQQARGNAHAGVYLGPGSFSNTVGATDPSLPTVISGNAGNGIEMNATRGNAVIGAFIGTTAYGAQALGNGANGILITNSFSNSVGGAAPGCGNGSQGSKANVIAFNAGNGVLVASGSGNGIHGNSIYSNALSGIDLALGANRNEAAPVITSVRTLARGVQIIGTVSGPANSTITVEFFGNTSSGPSGQYLLGSITVRTNRLGVANFTFRGDTVPQGASWFTATATGPGDNTSEFSAAVN